MLESTYRYFKDQGVLFVGVAVKDMSVIAGNISPNLASPTRM